MSWSERAEADEMLEDNDSCGLSERGHVLALRVKAREGKFGFSYHGYCGHDEDESGDNPEWFVVYFRDTHGWEVKGEEKRLHAMWAVKVKGKRLENVIRHISLGKRTTLKEGGTPDGERPHVSSIHVEPFEPSHVDDE